jgi:DNA mismatch repair ATPase MutS
MVETTIDLDALDNHEYIIKPEFDDHLKVIKKRLDKVRSEIQQEHKRVGRDLDQELDKKLMLENHRVHGWSFRLTRNVCDNHPLSAKTNRSTRKLAVLGISEVNIKKLPLRKTACSLLQLHYRLYDGTLISCPRITIELRAA